MTVHKTYQERSPNIVWGRAQEAIERLVDSSTVQEIRQFPLGTCWVKKKMYNRVSKQIVGQSVNGMWEWSLPPCFAPFLENELAI